jgi:hypothetical protein
MRLRTYFRIFNRSVATLRKDLISFIKLIHPDHFLHTSSSIKQTNLIFLQSLNELTDSLQQLSQQSEKLSSVEVNQPLLKNYMFKFYVKMPSLNEKNTEQQLKEEKNEELKEVKLLITTPIGLSTRAKLTKSQYDSALMKFLKQLGELFHSVSLPNPWRKKKEGEGDWEEGDEEEYETVQSTQESSGHHHWGKAPPNFVRRKKELFSEAEIEQVINEHHGNRRTEKDSIWMWDTNPAELQKIIHSFHYILPTETTGAGVPDRRSRKQAQQQPHQQAQYRDDVSSTYLSSLNDLAHHLYPSQVSSSHRHHPSSSIHRLEKRYTEHEIQRMVEINRFILNGHIFTQSLPSKDIEIHLLNSLRVFLFEYGEILNFSYRQWSDVILVITGNPQKTTAASTQAPGGSKKKLSKYEKEVQYYQQERVETNPSSSPPSPTASTAPPSHISTHTTILLTIPASFTPKILCSYLTRNLPHTNYFMKTKYVPFMESEEQR